MASTVAEIVALVEEEMTAALFLAEVMATVFQPRWKRLWFRCLRPCSRTAEIVSASGSAKTIPPNCGRLGKFRN